MEILLPQIAQIRTGYQFRKGVQDEVETGSQVGVIQVRDTENGVLKLDNIERARIKRPELYLVKPGDVLLLLRGQRFTATLVTTVPEEIIATHFFLTLRVHDPSVIMPAFLAWQLNHPHTQETFKGIARQTHIPFISRADVEMFRLAVPPLLAQEQIVGLDDLKKREAMLSAQLLQKRTRLIDALTLQLAAGQLGMSVTQDQT